MAHEVFVDTSGFYALLVGKDEMHARAAEWLGRAGKRGGRFVTSDYVLHETATLLRARGHGDQTRGLFDTVLSSRACRVEWMDAQRFELVRLFFEKHRDKEWSFTDCSSFVLMREGRMSDALTKDHHFRQASFRPLLV